MVMTNDTWFNEMDGEQAFPSQTEEIVTTARALVRSSACSTHVCLGRYESIRHRSKRRGRSPKRVGNTVRHDTDLGVKLPE
jgi:hypothetical protein